MKKKVLSSILSGLLILTLTACSVGNSSSGQEKGGAQASNQGEQGNKGTPAPDFEMVNLKGETVKLSDFKGEKVYVKYWASWCPICLTGLADINTLSGEDNDFKVVTIVSPGENGEKNMEDFKEWFSGVDNTNNITVLFDKDGDYMKKVGVRAYPTSGYVGSDGVLAKMIPGHADNEMIKAGFKDVQ